jgi:hypothetical protein
MKKITFLFISLLFCAGMQTQDVRKLDIDGTVINLESGQTYKIIPNSTNETFEIFKGETTQGVYSFSKTVNTVILKLNQSAITIGYESSFKLETTVVPEQGVTYTSDDPDIASVNSTTGVVTAGTTKGTTTITATTADNLQTTTCEVTVESLAERFEAAAGSTATIIMYADEEIPATITVDSVNTFITLTSCDDTERILKQTAAGYMFNISNKVTLDGHVTLKGLATSDYGGSDDINNNNSLVNVRANGEFTMLGHSKLTGNAYALDDYEGTSILGGGITVRSGGLLILDENAQLSYNTVCCAKPFPTPWNANNRNGKIAWGGGIYVTGSGIVEIRGNAKITGNRAINKGGNAYGGAIFPETDATIKMYGGEISGNSAEASHRAGGGALHLTTGILIMSGGVIKDNVVIYGGAGTGPACVVDLRENRFILSGSASIPAKSGTRISELSGYTTITGEGLTMRQDIGNTIWLNGGMIARVDGTLTGDAPVATFDINKTTTKALGKYDIATGTASDYTDDCPVDKFALHSYLIITAPYASLTLEAVTDKEIKLDGSVGDK